VHALTAAHEGIFPGRVGEQRHGSESLDVSYPAVPASLARARTAVAALAAAHGARAQELDRIRLVVSEAVANAVMHAYAGDPSGELHVSAAVIAGELTVVVGDDGCGLSAAGESPGLGHGLRVISDGCDALSILRRSGGGTQLEMRFVLERDPGERAREPVAERVTLEDR